MTHSSYATNIYLTYTEGTYPKTYEFATDTQQTMNKIGETNPSVQVKALVLQPFTDKVNTDFVLFRSLWNKSMRSTVKEDLYEKAMITTSRQLDIDIQHVYKENTDEYQSIYAKGRSAIYEGQSTHLQLVNLKAFCLSLADYPLIATLKTAYEVSVAKFNDVVMAAKDAKTDLYEHSKVMEKSRVRWCVKALGVTGGLMEIFEETPERIDDIFDLSIFATRQSHIDPDKGATVVPLAIGKLEVFNGVYDSSKTFQMHNCGFGNVQGGSLPASNTLIIPNPLTWLPDETKVVTGAQLGDIMNRFLGFISDDIDLPGEIRIKEVVV
ncbi:MAG: hypothetical protein WCL51_12180 [Bacteroidota bacterium]